MKLYLLKQKWTMNKTLILLKTVSLVINTCIPVSFLYIKGTSKNPICVEICILEKKKYLGWNCIYQKRNERWKKNVNFPENGLFCIQHPYSNKFTTGCNISENFHMASNCLAVFL